tara:strand:+ start:555 stop:758 length:204 start_codon:yes stop_codon:yes gene_type:complete
MIEITHEEFEKDYDSYLTKIEDGEQFLIRLPSGRAVAAVPQNAVGTKYVHPWDKYNESVEELQENAG